MCEQLVALVALAEFLNSKPNMNDPAREREASALLEALHEHDDAIEQARRRWQALLQGT
jgi:ferric-dicitrate binding protein FerR (iron transport regulator)